MSSLAARYVTPEQYLKSECEADGKSEYFSGQIFAMAGGTPEHSLQEYVLVSVSTPRVERFTRQADGQWLYQSVSGLDGELRLASLDVTLSLAEVYERVTFAPGEAGITEAGEHTE